jgi:Tol biopolymer transport system component
MSVVPAVLFAVVPDDQGLLHLIPGAEFLPVLISNCASPNELPVPCPGDQFHPHVDGDLVSYTSDGHIRYYDWFTGQDSAVPAAPDDWLSDVSGGKIAFTRTGADGGYDIYVYDPVTDTTTPVAPSSDSDRYFPSIGGNTVAFVDLGTYGAPSTTITVLVADLSDPSTAIPLTNSRFNGWTTGVGVSPAGDVVVWESCDDLNPSGCDIHKATRTGTSWVVDAVTTNPDEDKYPRTDGSVITYVSIRDGEQDIYWQAVGGGSEHRLAMPGEQGAWPAVAGGLIAFESVAVGETAGEVFVYHIATNRLFQITFTPDNETLSDLAVLPDGSYRLVWTSGNHSGGQGDVRGVTFTLPDVDTFTFGGFLAPVDPFPTFNSMKAGAAVAVKFSLGGFRGLDIFAQGYPTSSPTTCGGSSMEDPIEQTVTAGNSGLQYDAATDQYSYVWKTQKAWAGTCRQLKMQFTDGTVAYANFLFR